LHAIQWTDEVAQAENWTSLQLASDKDEAASSARVHQLGWKMISAKIAPTTF
jgi:hypothetical protein